MYCLWFCYSQWGFSVPPSMTRNPSIVIDCIVLLVSLARNHNWLINLLEITRRWASSRDSFTNSHESLIIIHIRINVSLVNAGNRNRCQSNVKIYLMVPFRIRSLLIACTKTSWRTFGLFFRSFCSMTTPRRCMTSLAIKVIKQSMIQHTAHCHLDQCTNENCHSCSVFTRQAAIQPSLINSLL